MLMTFSRSNRANLYVLCRGIWLFAVKAHHSLFWVESQLGHSIAYSTVHEALRSMADQKMKDLRNAAHTGLGRHFIIVSNNIEVYLQQRDHRIGQESKMSKGLAGTAVEMENVPPEALQNLHIVKPCRSTGHFLQT